MTATTSNAEPWPPEEAARLGRMAHQQFTDEWHGSGGCIKEGRLGRENCGPCCLLGYEPRGGFGDDDFKVRRDGPNYAGWARTYVEANFSIPSKWKDAFQRERDSDNKLYAAALERSIATFGVNWK